MTSSNSAELLLMSSYANRPTRTSSIGDINLWAMVPYDPIHKELN